MPDADSVSTLPGAVLDVEAVRMQGRWPSFTDVAQWDARKQREMETVGEPRWKTSQRRWLPAAEASPSMFPVSLLQEKEADRRALSPEHCPENSALCPHAQASLHPRAAEVTVQRKGTCSESPIWQMARWRGEPKSVPTPPRGLHMASPYTHRLCLPWGRGWEGWLSRAWATTLSHREGHLG